MNGMTRLATLALVVAVSGCAWVQPTSGGARVTQVTPEQANFCEKLGQTRANTQFKVGFIPRNDAKVAEELLIMARNSAADMGGNAVIPLTAPVDGRQSFAILKCSNLP